MSTIKLEVGKSYLNVLGSIVRIVKFNSVTQRFICGYGCEYSSDGTFGDGFHPEFAIVKTYGSK
jgi:hypothetical protein